MYAIMAYVCVAVMPNFYEIDNLATVAGQFMGQGMLVFFILGGFDLDDVVKITTIPGLLLSPIIFLSVFFLKKRYPNCYQNSYLRMPHWLACVFAVVAMVVCFRLGYYVLFQMQPHNWIAMIVYYALAAIYTVFRFFYIKKKEGVNLFEKMRATYQPWEAREEELAAEKK